MKRLIALLVTITLSLTASSQAVTKDSSFYTLPAPWARQIVIELLRGDSTRDENTLLWKNIDILNDQVKYKDVMIAGKDSMISLKNEIITSKDTTISYMSRQVTEYKNLSQSLEKKYDRQKRNSIFKDVSATAIIAGLLAILIFR